MCSRQWPRNPLEPSSEGNQATVEQNRTEASHCSIVVLAFLEHDSPTVCTIARRDENPAGKIECLTALWNYVH